MSCVFFKDASLSNCNGILFLMDSPSINLYTGFAQSLQRTRDSTFHLINRKKQQDELAKRGRTQIQNLLESLVIATLHTLLMYLFLVNLIIYMVNKKKKKRDQN